MLFHRGNRGNQKMQYHKLMRQLIARASVSCFFTLALLIIGCAPVSLRQGRGYLATGEYPQAVEALTNALNENPDNPEIRRDLGIAYYRSQQYTLALNELTQARQKLKKDSHLIFYLGLTYEQLEQYDKAIEEYLHYTRLSRFSPMRKQIQQRVELLIPRATDQWAKKRIAEEEKLDVSEIPDNSVAVTYFEPRGVSEELEPLHKGLTDLLIVDLTLIEGLIIVERIKLKEIYDEIALRLTDLVDPQTALRVGNLLGAKTIVTGYFTGLGEREGAQWRIYPRLGMVKSSEVRLMKGSEGELVDFIQGELADFIQVEKTLALQILDSLDIELTPAERKRIEEKIKQNIPTRSLEAFLAYSRGLDYQDQGMYKQAENEFEQAISRDRKFDQAKEQLNITKLLSKAVESYGPPQEAGAPPPIPPPDDLEEEWVATANEEALRNNVLTTTVASVSQTVSEGSEESISRGSPPRVSEREVPEEVQVEIEIRW